MRSHVALVSAYPRESDARMGVARDCGNGPTADYRGIWRLPDPYGGLVHLFSDEDTAVLNRRGWTLAQSALPADGDATFVLEREWRREDQNATLGR